MPEDQTWIVRVDVDDWQNRKCTDTLEALDIKVTTKGLPPRAVPQAGWVELELRAADQTEARERVMGGLERCGAQGTIGDVSLAPDLGSLSPSD